MGHSNVKHSLVEHTIAIVLKNSTTHLTPNSFRSGI